MSNLHATTNILVTGATGYVGGRLVPELLAGGYHVRCLVRDASRLQGRPWVDNVEIAVGDVLDASTLATAMHGTDVAYYLVHSMQGSADFRRRDIDAARRFGAAARAAGVRRIVYLGGLGDRSTRLSDHLRSRQETGDALRESGIPVTEFRAAIIVGAGSASFEIIRYLTERVPVMVCPRWVFTRVQPIATSDVLRYLVAALAHPESAGRTIDIGSPDILSYGDMLLGYAEVRGLRRVLLPVPVLTPRLSAYWVHWTTPIPASIAHPLIEGLRNEVIVGDGTALTLFPEIRPVTYATAVRMALDQLTAGDVETSWSDALSTSRRDIPPVLLTTEQGMIVERRRHEVSASPESVFEAYTELGGDRGWLAANWAWYARGVMDRLVGGVGFRRGRRHPKEVRVGDAIDFWRVEAVESPRLLRLHAEMKVPGRAWLQFESAPAGNGRTTLRQTAYFAPKGLPGLLYWYLLYPIHSVIFSGLIAKIARRAEATEPNDASASPVVAIPGESSGKAS